MKGAIVGIAIALAVVGVGAGIYLALPKEVGQVILDDTASVHIINPKQYSRELEAGQVIHVYAKVDQHPADVNNLWDVDLTIKDPNAQILSSTEMFEVDPYTGAEEYSFDITITSSGIHTFEIMNYGDYFAEVRIKVSLIGSEELEPARFEVVSLTLSPTEAKIGEEVTISAEVKNIGETTGVHWAVLTINGEEVEAKGVTITSGETETVTFTIVENVEGFHTIRVGGLIRSLLVKPTTPATFEVSNLTINPSEVEAGNPAEISVTVTNTGDLGGTHTVTLKIDHETEDTKEVTLAGGASQTVSFTVTEDIAGTYAIEVNGLTKNLEVLEPPEVSNLPFEISNLTFPSTVGVGGMVKIEVMLSNLRDTRNTYPVALRIDNGIKATKEVTLGAWTEQTVSFTVTEDVVGTHTVSVDGLQGTLKVLEATVGLWHLDGNANDETANANHGTVYGATVTPGKFSGAYDFDGIDDYISGPTHVFAMPEEVTFEAWVKPASFPTGDAQTILAHGDGGHITLALVPGGVFAFGVWHPDVTWTVVRSEEKTINDWYHVAGVWKNLSYIRIYVNGVLENDIPVTKALGNAGGSYPFIIGAYNKADRQFWHGIIDEIRISRVARTADEIKSHFESGLPHHE